MKRYTVGDIIEMQASGEPIPPDVQAEMARVAQAVQKMVGGNRSRDLLAEAQRLLNEVTDGWKRDIESRGLDPADLHLIMKQLAKQGVETHDMETALQELAMMVLRERITATKRIQKSSTITKDDLTNAEREHPARADQAKRLGISERHLRRLRKEML